MCLRICGLLDEQDLFFFLKKRKEEGCNVSLNNSVLLALQ